MRAPRKAERVALERAKLSAPCDLAREVRGSLGSRLPVESPRLCQNLPKNAINNLTKNDNLIPHSLAQCWQQINRPHGSEPLRDGAHDRAEAPAGGLRAHA